MLTARIAELDLDPIKIKLMDSDEGEGWTRQQVDAVETHYRRFLDLNLKHPDIPIVPNGPVDKFWHYHILDTMKYAEDCLAIFGYFLHHFPYFGMRSDVDRQNLESAFDKTKELLLQEYGDDPGSIRDVGLEADSPRVCSDSPTNCNGSSCNGQRCGGSGIHDYVRPSFANV
jgi:hypothetical protein